jgi:glycosyltransferase involved in cell wall biosynthesis
MVEPRIFFINRVYWPAEEATAQLLTDLAEGLAAQGWPVHVISTGNQSGPHNGVVIHRARPAAEHRGLVSRALNYRHFLGAACQHLEALIRPGDIVIPMTDPPMLGAALTGMALKRGAKVIHWIQDIYPEIVTAHLGAAIGLPFFLLRRKRDAAWRSAWRCVTLGTDMAQTIAARSVPVGHILTVPNWAPRELQAAASPADVAAQRAGWGLADKFVIAYSGNLGRVHDFTAVLDAAEHLKDRTEFVFLFIGTGARHAEVRTATVARKLANIRFLPPVSRDQLATSLAAADVQLVTLRPEFTPLVYPSKLAGALAAGRPVLFVGPSAGEIVQLLAGAQCGCSVTPKEGARLAETLVRWRERPEQLAAYGRNARSAYEGYFTLKTALQRWTEIIAQTRQTP